MLETTLAIQSARNNDRRRGLQADARGVAASFAETLAFLVVDLAIRVIRFLDFD
jgi:hypothetical protein